MAKESKGARRARNYATVVYPESAPENWREILGEQKVAAFVSPLHNMDVNPTGEVKKDHYHVIIMYEGMKSADQVIEVFEQIGGVGCEVVQSIRGYARYLCHLDNPEKAQYREEDVQCFGGADYAATIGLAIDKYKAVKEMIEFCISNNIVSYSDLLEYSMEHRFDKYLARIADEAENDLIIEKNRVHWRKATSDDYVRIALAMARLEQISAISRDLHTIIKLHG